MGLSTLPCTRRPLEHVKKGINGNGHFFLLGEAQAHAHPTVLTYNATLSACGKGTQWQRAIQLMDEFPRGIQTDEVTYNTVIDACGKGGHWTGGLSLLASMTQCVPSTITYTSAAIACARALQWQWPLALLSEMEHRSVSPNDVTFGVLIS